MTFDQSKNIEIWKPVEGFEDEYEVSTLGRVRSTDREVHYLHKGTTPRVRSFPSKILSPSFTTGYALYVLSVNQEKKCIKGHRLVAKAFIPAVDGKTDVNHKNGDKADNRVENLEWVTDSENMLHACRVLMKRQGDNHANATLTYKMVDMIRTRKNNGETFTKIAKDIGVAISTVARAYKNWGGCRV